MEKQKEDFDAVYKEVKERVNALPGWKKPARQHVVTELLERTFE